MDDQGDAGRADAMLRRPAVDPGIPRRDRDLLTAPGTLLTSAHRDRPGRHRDYLPADPGKRGAAIDGAVMGMSAAAVTASASCSADRAPGLFMASPQARRLRRGDGRRSRAARAEAVEPGEGVQGGLPFRHRSRRAFGVSAV